MCRRPRRREPSLLEEWALSQHPARGKTSHAATQVSFSERKTCTYPASACLPVSAHWHRWLTPTSRGAGVALLCCFPLTLGQGVVAECRMGPPCKYEELSTEAGGAPAYIWSFSHRSVPVCSFQLVNSGGERMGVSKKPSGN